MEVIEVQAQFPGVLYRRPGPDQPSFAEVGDEVAPGQTLGLVEIMKQFMPLVSDVAGTLVDVCVPEYDNVDTGTVVFKIERAG